MKPKLFLRLALGAAGVVLNQAAAQTIEVTSTGVGIGTSAPANLVHVYGNQNSSSELILQNPHTGANAYTGEEILADKAAVVLRAYGSGFSTFTHGGLSLAQSVELWADTYAGTGPQAFLIGIGTNKPLIFSTNNAEALRITGSGNVGIGTTSPATKLEVKGDELRIRSIVAKTDVTGRGLLRLTSDDTVGTNNLEMLFTLQGSVTSGARYGQIQVADNGYFWGNFVVNPYGGNVGIGTSSPSAKLQIGVTDAGSVNEGIELDRLGAATSKFSMKLISDAAGYYRGALEFTQNGGGGVVEAISIGNEAVGGTVNVGIGTTTPGYKLEVAGSVRATSFIANGNTYADFVFKPGYPLRSLSEVEAAIKAHGHLPDIPSEAEAKARGIDLAAMQVKLLQKVEELTLYLVAHEKELRTQKEEVQQLRARNETLEHQVSELEKR